jgi:hypothetical protein
MEEMEEMEEKESKVMLQPLNWTLDNYQIILIHYQHLWTSMRG